MLTLIKNGYVIDPASGREGVYDILIEDEQIVKVTPGINEEAIRLEEESAGRPFTCIDAKGNYVMPGFIDLHVHLREPGFEYKETIRTGAMAAAAGGYTTICPMPNTKPAIDSAELVAWLRNKATEEAVVHIMPVGAITKGQAGVELVNIQELKTAGVTALSEDGKSVMDAGIYTEAMRQAAKYDIPILAHCEDKNLVGNGVINSGRKAVELNLPGISNAVEDVITARDILLAKETGARLHLCHCSTRDSARMIALAKEDNVNVTGEVCPHHFSLSDEDIPSDNADYKMNPPLRSPEDVKALKEALRDGIIDVISTDHAPHSSEEKAKSFLEAPFGIVGSETAFALSYTELVQKGYLTISQLVEKMSVNPAKVLKINRGCIGEGNSADIVIADPKAEYIINRDEFKSKGRNTPFHGRKVTGRVMYTIVAGKLVYEYKS